MMSRRRRWTALGLPITILMVLATLTLGMSAPRASAAQGDDVPHPGHIHTGTCEQLGDIAFPLSNIAAIRGGEDLGNASAVPVEASETVVDVSLGELLNGEFAVNLHRSAQAIQDYIACGDIGGRVVDGTLVIGLQEVNGSGFTGVALLADNGEKTGVTIYLVQAKGAGEATPAAAAAGATDAKPTKEAAKPTKEAGAKPTKEAGAKPTKEAGAKPTKEAASGAADEQAAPQEVGIDIVDFGFNPGTIEVPVGSTVTWTNTGAAPHTVTSDDGAFDSGALQPGDTFSATFSAPGTFAYHCDIHPAMTATVVVTGSASAAPAGQEGAAAPADGQEAAVEILNFAFNPGAITVKAGDTITWTNQDGVPHTATANDSDLLQTGAIAPGESVSQVFDTPGTIEYHCEFHANMTGTITVE